MLGDADRGEITLDWGANASVLFGRQKTKGHHQTTEKAYYLNHWKSRTIGRPLVGKPLIDGHFQNKTAAAHYSTNNQYYTGHPTAQTAKAASFNRTRTVIVPNLGGTAGFSFRYTNAKVSFGYRADFFFGAMDGGIDTRQNREHRVPRSLCQHQRRVSVMGRWESRFRPIISPPVSAFRSWSARGRHMMGWDGGREPIWETCWLLRDAHPTLRLHRLRAPGDRRRDGQKLGAAGRCGSANQAHLHTEAPHRASDNSERGRVGEAEIHARTHILRAVWPLVFCEPDACSAKGDFAGRQDGNASRVHLTIC